MGQGLRERKRAALERELAIAALTLVESRGFSSVTVDDIVAMSGVSRRTFSNHFACKEDAVAAVVLHRAGDALESWRPASPHDGLVPVVRSLIAHQRRSGTFATMAAVSRLARDHHQLVPYLREAQWSLWTMAPRAHPHPTGARLHDAIADTSHAGYVATEKTKALTP